MRVACLNNYPLAKMWARARAGDGPAQHLWGVDALELAGLDVMLAPFNEPDKGVVLDRVSRRLRQRAGQLDQELWAVRQRPDVYYSGDQSSSRGLALARTRGRHVCVAHHPIVMTSVATRTYGGYDQILALSEQLAGELRASGLNAEFAPWGPDLESPVYAERPSGDRAQLVVSAGKSNRDFSTLISALARDGSASLVYDTGAVIGAAPANVELVRSGGPGADPDAPSGYLPSRVYSDLRRATVIAVPALDPNRLTGLTELNDALALGIPVIVTRSRYLPVDVEAIGCGVAVDPGDVDGWERALALMSNTATRREMGEAGRTWAEQGWNYAAFSERVVAAVGG